MTSKTPSKAILAITILLVGCSRSEPSIYLDSSITKDSYEIVIQTTEEYLNISPAGLVSLRQGDRHELIEYGSTEEMPTRYYPKGAVYRAKLNVLHRCVLCLFEEQSHNFSKGAEVHFLPAK